VIKEGGGRILGNHGIWGSDQRGRILGNHLPTNKKKSNYRFDRSTGSRLTTSKQSGEIKPPQGRLGVLLPGLSGAVSTTFIAGIEAIKRGLGKPFGSLTQMGTIRLGKRTEKRSPHILDFVPLAHTQDLVFGGWDIFPDNSYEAALKAGVLEKNLLDELRFELEEIKPMPAVFDRRYVRNLKGI